MLCYSIVDYAIAYAMTRCGTPNPPTNIVPTDIARVKLFGEIPRISLWAWEFHPFRLRLCSSQTL